MEVGTKLIRTQTGQPYTINSIRKTKLKGRLFKKERMYYLKSHIHYSLDLLVHEHELHSLFTVVSEEALAKMGE